MEVEVEGSLQQGRGDVDGVERVIFSLQVIK